MSWLLPRELSKKKYLPSRVQFPQHSCEGWFHPAQSRYGWRWLADRYDADHDGTITRQEFAGPDELFRRSEDVIDFSLAAPLAAPPVPYEPLPVPYEPVLFAPPAPIDPLFRPLP